MNRYSIFKNPRSLYTFSVLFTSIIVLLTCSFFLVGLYRSYVHLASETVSPTHIMAVVRVAQTAPADTPIIETNKALVSFSTPVLRFKIAKQPARHATLLSPLTTKTVQQALKSNMSAFSAELPGERWLNVSIDKPPAHEIIFASTIFLLLLIIFAIFIVCGWAVRRLSLPFSHLTNTIDQMGSTDLNTPLMPITSIKEVSDATSKLNRMREKLQKLLHDRTSMLAAISHDLRTPITRVKLRAEYFEDSPHYQKMINDLNDMDTMINSILSFARDYMHEEIPENFDMDALVQTICDNMEDAGKQIAFHSKHKRTPFTGRITAIKRSLTNLIDNAIKYGNKADVTLNFDKKRLAITIDDEGPGIPLEAQESVFTPFYRMDKSRNATISGTGLGMTVAKDIIQSHNGTISLNNRPEGGLRITVTF